MLSILMSAKNAAAYVREAVESIQPAEFDWELVVVEDHSTDSTWSLLREIAAHNPRVHTYRNDGIGKVAALNQAYARCGGDFITTLDSDDALDPEYFSNIEPLLRDADAVFRDYIVTDSNLNPIGTYRMSNELIRRPFAEVVSGLVSLPRATWTFTRRIGDRIFPVPTNLPFEDVWFSLVIKRFADRVRHMERPAYFYRQHESQTFGGVLAYEPQKTRFRAQRLVRYAELLPNYASRFDFDRLPDLNSVHGLYSLMMQETLTLGDIIRSPCKTGSKAKLVLFRKLWPVIAIAKRVQWSLDALRRRRAAQ